MNPIDQFKEKLGVWRADYQEFAADCLKITDLHGNELPFVFNRSQRYFWALEQKFLSQGRPFWLVVLKGRRVGSSRYFSTRLGWKAWLNPNTNCYIRAHDDPTTSEIFKMPKYSFKNLPAALKSIMVKLDNEHVWEFANPNPKGAAGLDSRIFASTAGSENVGAGFGIHHLHFAEFGRYDEVTDVQKMMATIMQTVPKNSPNVSVIIESTAHGEGSFKRYYENESLGFQPEFISYVANENDRKESERFDLSGVSESKYGDEEEEAELIRKEILRWYPEWDERIHSSEIEHEVYCRLAWRRDTIDRFCGEDKSVFDQEYPITADRAFMLSGSSFFDNSVVVYFINELKEEERVAKEVDRPLYTRFKFDPTFEIKSVSTNPKILFDEVFRKSGFGPLYIFEPPLPGVSYGLGCDPSLGIVGGDEAAISVLRVPDRYEVAHYAVQTDADLLADIVYVLGLFYNKALLGIEMNPGGGGETVLNKLLRVLKYPSSKVYRDKIYDKTKVDTSLRYGWQSNVKSKGKLLGDYRGVVRDENIKFNSLDNLKEHKAFKFFPDKDGSGRVIEKCFVAGPGGGKQSPNRIIATALASLMVEVYPIYVAQNAREPERNSIKYWEKYIGESFIDSPARHNIRLNRW